MLMNMKVRLRNFIPVLSFVLFCICVISCSKEEDVRKPDDLVGIWSPSDSCFLEFGEDYTVHKLEIEYQDGESIGIWTTDAYLYEPGYHLAIYLLGTRVEVYQIIELTSKEMTWCWVDEVEITEGANKETIGHLVGDIIKKAQEGFKLNPELYQTFRKVSDNEFFTILEKLDIMYPW